MASRIPELQSLQHAQAGAKPAAFDLARISPQAKPYSSGDKQSDKDAVDELSTHRPWRVFEQLPPLAEFLELIGSNKLKPTATH